MNKADIVGGLDAPGMKQCIQIFAIFSGQIGSEITSDKSNSHCIALPKILRGRPITDFYQVSSSRSTAVYHVLFQGGIRMARLLRHEFARLSTPKFWMVGSA